MPTPGSRGSSIWRRGASVGSRLTEGLLSSSGRVAVIGLVTAVTTLVFAIWFGLELRHASRVGVPMMRAAAVMNTSINQSLAALRGWVAYGDPASLAERGRLWHDEIEPTLAALSRLAGSSRDPEVVAEVAELGQAIRELRVVQWAIQDVAQTPGNEPARVAYWKRLEPLRRNVLRTLDGAIEQFSRSGGDPASIGFLAKLAGLRSAFGRLDLAVGELIDAFDEVREHAVDEGRDRVRDLSDEIREQMPSPLSRPLVGDAAVELAGDLPAMIDFALEEALAYDLQLPEVIAIRRSASWDVARRLFVEDAAPLVQRARELASDLAERQSARAVENADRMSRASYGVIAMALLMGLISGGSLLVSFQLQRQVHNVMDRAKRLGQYEIEERIGKGGMGEVYLGRHAMLRRPTALKLLRAENAQDLRAQERFQREVQLTCQLSHPNTIEIFDYGKTPQGIFYYAMELLDGFTIESLVALAGPVDPRRVVHILVQACGSLQEAHHKGLLHRDIKPSNIMLTQRGGISDTVKILDFGLVKELSDDAAGRRDEREVIVGTPMYLAPELILDADATSAQSDLYALGAVAYFMLAGSTIFPHGPVVQMLTHQLDDDPPFPSERSGRALPQDLEYVVMACLAKDPSDRPASAEQLASLLTGCDLPPWTAQDARLWWEEYGEAARNLAAGDESTGSGVGSGLEIVVEDSRV